MNGKKALISTVALAGAMAAGPVFSGAAGNLLSDAQLHDEPAGVLVYPIFNLGDHGANGVYNTQIRITNVANQYHYVALKTICGTNKLNVPAQDHYYCRSNSAVFEMTPRETRVIDVRNLAPNCTTGYIVAYVVDTDDGDGLPLPAVLDGDQVVPINPLIGSYLLKHTNPTRGGADQAIPIQAVGLGNGDEDLDFNDLEYSVVSNEVWSDFRAIDFNDPEINGDNESTYLVLLTLDVLAGQNNGETTYNIDAWNEDEYNYDAFGQFFCHSYEKLDFLDGKVGSNFRVGAPFGQQEWKYGSMRVRADFGSQNSLLGAIIEQGSEYTSARNMIHVGAATTVFDMPE